MGALLDDDLPHDLAGEEEIAAQHDEADHALRLRSGTIAGAALESRNSGGSPGSGSPAGSQAVFSPGGTRHSRGSSKGELLSEGGAGVSRDVSGAAAAAGPPHHSSTSGVLEDATLSQNPLAGQNAPATIKSVRIGAADRRQLTSNPRSIRQSGHPVEESHGLNRRRTLLGPATVWADNVNPHPCGSRKMVERAAVDYAGTR